MLTIIHGADFHLDAPFAALPPDKARARRAEQRELLDRLAGLAEERRADVVLLSASLRLAWRVLRALSSSWALFRVSRSGGAPWRVRSASRPSTWAWASARAAWAASHRALRWAMARLRWASRSDSRSLCSAWSRSSSRLASWARRKALDWRARVSSTSASSSSSRGIRPVLLCFRRLSQSRRRRSTWE